MGRCSPLLTAVIVAAVMCVDAVRSAVSQPMDAVVSAAATKPQLTAAVVVISLLAYAWMQYRALQVPVVDVPLTENETGTKQAPSTCQPGELRDPTRPGWIQCWDPSTNEYLGQVPAMSREDVIATVARARKAQAAWRTTSFNERRRVMRMLNSAMLARQDDICALSTRDSGKTFMDGLLGEIMTTAEKISWINREGEDALRPSKRSTNLMMIHKSARVEYVPVGVLGVIAPWNYPFHNMLNHVISGLFAGNAVVTKPSEYTSWSAPYFLRMVREVLRAAGHDPELVQIVTGFAEAGVALVESDVDKIVFTGSPGIGRHIMRGCAKTLKPVVLELGGKDPVIVCEDADFDQVFAYCMRGTFTNAGQNCIGIERIYVYEQIFDKFVERVSAAAKKFVQGPPLGNAFVDAGAMTMPGQLDIVDELVQDAVRRGATLVCGGKRSPTLKGQFYEPTVLVNVTHDMRIANEEVFGPVMSIFKVTGGDEECIRLVNSTEYGLGSSVFTTNLARGEAIQRAVRAGMTCINDFGLNYMAQSLPFGGVGISGFGRFGGAEGLRACCHMKSIITDIVPGIRTQIPGVIQYPMNPGSVRFTKGLLGMMYAPTVGGKIRGVLSLMCAKRVKPATADKKQQ